MTTVREMSGIRSFGSAHRYYQGPGALQLCGSAVAALGRSAVLVCDQVVHDLVAPVVRPACERTGVTLRWVEVRGDVTRRAVQDLVAQAGKADVVVAAGGGKGVDTGKAVSRELGAHLVVIPTAASNDGPCSESFVYYDDRHRMESVEHLPRNPDVVLVDTVILARAPKALLVSGIGDALCKLYEGSQARQARGRNLFGGLGTLAAEQLAIACDRAIRDNAVEGLLAAASGQPTEAFENLVEALVLLSGLAFENNGLSIAHSMSRGLTRIEAIASQLHGQQVAYGLMVQWALEKRDVAFMAEQLAFYRSVGLATSLTQLGVSEVNAALLDEIATGTMTAPHLKHFERPLEAQDFVAAMAEVERLTSTH
ncbi:glycerol dehydrogenase [Caldimonas thermodepolymerans]|uniref:glycerol dehydrogenase n=1 Tax=Caldimonas thermodepolymerans TaxID=215580 RepID=UPI002235F71D|nr:glycerol dehydrogenase [Caldimonas thermodepolymerans]UZG44400.1 glycerol dehydrogenase [Caldimonas thermodepolymerans]